MREIPTARRVLAAHPAEAMPVPDGGVFAGEFAMKRALCGSALVLCCLGASVPALFAEPAGTKEATGPWQRRTTPVLGTARSRRSIEPTSRRLTAAFTFSTGVVRGHEAAPIVADDTMYIVTPYPNIVYALDLSQARRA